MRDNPLDYLVAKKAKDKWLSLFSHQRDTEGVITYLLKNYVSESFLQYSGIDRETIHKIATFLALTHDMGKFTAFFQHKITAENPALRNMVENEVYGCSLNFENDTINHSLYTELILLLCGCPTCITDILGAHHGKPSDEGDIMDYNLNIDSWIDIKNNKKVFGAKNNVESICGAWKRYVVLSLNRAGFNAFDELPEILPESVQMLLSGLLIMADWIASNTDYFPLVSIKENITELDYPLRVDNALLKLKFTDRWSPSKSCFSVADFEKVFGFPANDVQRQLLEAVSASPRAGIYILEAPMGIGKTEAALAACLMIAGKEGKNGLFFGMPSQATANGIFRRIEKWAEAQSDKSLHSIILKHGASDLNEDFARLREHVPDSYTEQDGLAVHNWFLSSKKSSLATFVVGTVDRLLMMALKRKHVMLLHFGLSEKVVIIDECHAYDAYMNCYLYRALRWLGEYNTPVILLSATLDAAKRLELISAYSGKDCNSIDKSIISETSYPLLTYYDGQVKSLPMKYDGIYKTVKCSVSEDSTVFSQVEQALSCGACVGIITNTVRRAQMFYDRLGNHSPILYHSQYIGQHRSDKERGLLKLVGKDSTADIRFGVCVIGTQVLEQSLDIDFDLLITDIAPMDLLLQRIGRLHRHIRPRPNGFNEARCVVLTDELTNDNRTGSKTIYTSWLLNKTLSCLKEEIRLPDDISSLVQSVYSAVEESNKDYVEYRDKIEKMKGQAQAFLLSEPINCSLHNLLDREVRDSDGNAAVRLGDPTVEVLLFKCAENGDVTLLDGTPIPNNPTNQDYLLIAKQTIRLPGAVLASKPIDYVIKELEKNNQICSFLTRSYLTTDTPVLLLDENNNGELLDYTLNYSYEYGLKYSKKG